MRLGIIGSSGGSVLASAVACLEAAHKKIDLVVVSDRNCGLIDWAKKNNYPTAEIAYQDAATFSTDALSYLLAQGVQHVLLFYTRKVSDPLINNLSIYNIHPSLLPSFKGLYGVQDALKAGSRVLGATLHVVDENLDTGRNIAQIATGLPIDVSEQMANKISYLQKVYLTLLWYELVNESGMKINKDTHSVCFEKKLSSTVNCSPSIVDQSLLEQFNILQNKENYHVT